MVSKTQMKAYFSTGVLILAAASLAIIGAIGAGSLLDDPKHAAQLSRPVLSAIRAF